MFAHEMFAYEMHKDHAAELRREAALDHLAREAAQGRRERKNRKRDDRRAAGRQQWTKAA